MDKADYDVIVIGAGRRQRMSPTVRSKEDCGPPLLNQNLLAVNAVIFRTGGRGGIRAQNRHFLKQSLSILFSIQADSVTIRNNPLVSFTDTFTDSFGRG